jgi:succinoglycan biosynthesis protein ExoH
MLGLAGIAALFLTDMDGYLILRGDMPVEFYLGGMLALRKVDLTCADKYAFPAIGLFLAACVVVTWFDWPIILPLRLVSPFLIWPVGAILVGTFAGRWLIKQSRYSFFIFIAHAPLLMVLWTLNKYTGRPIPEYAFPVIAPFVTAALLIALYQLAARLAPVWFAIATGTRATAKVRRDRRVASADAGTWSAEKERRVTRA